MSKVCNPQHDDWDEKINTILIGYRASRQASTEHSPCYMLFQQEMKLPIDSEIMSRGNGDDAAEMLCTSNDDEQSVDKVVEQLLVNRQQVFQTISDNIKAAQHTQKQQYDKRHVPEELKVGTEDLLENTAQKQCSKTKKRWKI